MLTAYHQSKTKNDAASTLKQEQAPQSVKITEHKPEEIPDTVKGLLFTIKDSQGVVKGYLCGTMHKLEPESLDRLDPIIFDKLTGSSRLFTEMNEEEMIEEFILTKLKQEVNITVEELDEYKTEISKILEKVGLDGWLINKAKKLGIPTLGLENRKTKEKSDRVEKEEEDYLTIKKDLFALICLQQYFKYKSILNEKEKKFVSTWSEFDNKQVSGVKFLLKEVHKEEINRWKEIVNSLLQRAYDNLSPHTILLNPDLKKFLFQQLHIEDSSSIRETAKIHFKRIVSQSQELEKVWASGDIKAMEKYIKKFEEVSGSYLATNRVRDRILAEAIHHDLEECSDGTPGFYAVGAYHLLDDEKILHRENIRDILERKGWSIESIYNLKNNTEFVGKKTKEKSLFDSMPFPRSMTIKRFYKELMKYGITHVLANKDHPEILELLNLKELGPGVVRKMDERLYKTLSKSILDELARQFRAIEKEIAVSGCSLNGEKYKSILAHEELITKFPTYVSFSPDEHDWEPSSEESKASMSFKKFAP